MYKVEDQKFVGIQNSFQSFTMEIGQIERVFVELIEFIEKSSQPEMLLHIKDIGEWMRTSFDQLEHMAKVSVTMKKELYISKSLSPFIVNTSNTLDLINKFEMVPPSKELFNNFELKFLKEAPAFNQSPNGQLSPMTLD